MVDECSRLCIDPEIDTKNVKQAFNVSAAQVQKLYLDHWHSHYGEPLRLHTDPEGAFRGKQLLDFFRESGIFHDVAAGEDHWQNGIVERTIGSVRRIVERLFVLYPDVATAQLVQIACQAHNDLERVKGFSPLQ